MKHKVSELEGPLLAHAVALACGYKVEKDGSDWCVWLPAEATPDAMPCGSFSKYGWRPDNKWMHGGPLIERERIMLSSYANGEWEAFALAPDRAVERLDSGKMRGPTPLIAAMRAFVASKLGDEVEIEEPAIGGMPLAGA